MIAVLIPSMTTLQQASQMANAAHLHLITRNGKTVLSPCIPKGWTKVSGTTPGNEVSQ